MTETILIAIITGFFGLVGGALVSIPTALKLRADARTNAKQSDIEALQNALKSLQSENERLRERLQELEDDVEARDARISALEAANAKKNEQIAFLKRDLTETTIARNDRIQRIQELEGELQELRAKVGKIEKRDTGSLDPGKAKKG